MSDIPKKIKAKGEEMVPTSTTYKLEDTWMFVCSTTLLVFIFYLKFFIVTGFEKYQDSKYTLYEPNGSGGIVNYDNKTENHWLSIVAVIAFGTSVVCSLSSLFFVSPSKRPAIACTIVINGIAGYTHYSFIMGSYPVFDNCFGRKMNVIRFGEWWSLVFMLIFIVNVIDKVDREEFFRSISCQLASVIIGSLSSFSCHLNWGMDNVPASEGHWKHRGVSDPNDAWWTPSAIYHSSKSMKICLVLLVISCILFCDLYRVVERRLSCRTTKNPTLATLTVWCSLSWTAVVFIYLIGCLNVSWFPIETEDISNIIGDLFAKFMYAHILGDNHRQLQDIDNDFAEQLENKEEINQSQSHFLRYVFHEVRVPLNTIKLGLDSIRMSDEASEVNMDQDVKFVFSCMNSAVDNMSDTLNDVLAFQKVKEKKVDLLQAEVYIRDVVREVTTQFENNFEDKKLKIGVLIDPKIPMRVYVDGLRVRQVLSHFISTAIKHYNAKTMVVSAFQYTNTPSELKKAQMLYQGSRKDANVTFVKFSVLIEGVVILPEDQESIFEAYTQIRTGDLVAGDGTSGLGLCICKHLVAIMGGKVGVDEDTHGHNSSLYFTLPLFGDRQSQADSSNILQRTLQFFYPTPNKQSEKEGEKAPMDRRTVTRKSISAPELDMERKDDNLLPAVRRIRNNVGSVKGSLKLKQEKETKNMEKERKEKKTKGGNIQKDEDFAKKPADDVKDKAKYSRRIVTSPTISDVDKVSSGNSSSSMACLSGSSSVEEKRLDVLVVDDVKLNRRLMKRCVDQLNFDCDEAADGAIAVQMCTAKSYDIILMDNSMPNMTGVEATKRIRAQHGESLLIFGVTGNALSEDVIEFKEAGCNEVLLKPLDFQQFLQYLVKHGVKDVGVSALIEKHAQSRSPRAPTNQDTTAVHKVASQEQDKEAKSDDSSAAADSSASSKSLTPKSAPPTYHFPG